jgi:hypothetical protein
MTKALLLTMKGPLRDLPAERNCKGDGSKK